MIVRAGTQDDCAWMLEQLKEFAAFFGSKHSLFDAAYASQALPVFIRDQMLLVAQGDDGSRHGFLGAQYGRHPYNPQIDFIAESFWWCETSHRGGRAALMLLDEFIAVSKLMNPKWIIFTLEARSPVRDETLIKRGFHMHEKSYMMELG